MRLVRSDVNRPHFALTNISVDNHYIRYWDGCTDKMFYFLLIPFSSTFIIERCIDFRFFNLSDNQYDYLNGT
jgi:hypothetical protein